MPLEVRYGSKTFPIDVPDTCTFGELKQLISDATGVLPPLQKLLGKPGLQQKPDDASLQSLGINNKTKLMLIGSTAAEVVKANAPTEAEKKKDEERARMLRNLPYHFWLLPSYGGLLADPYVNGRGNPVEGGSAVLALLSLDVILSRINTLGALSSSTTVTCGSLLNTLGQEGSAQVSHRFLKHLNAEQRVAIQKAHAVVRRCYLFTMEASKAVAPNDVLAVVDTCLTAIEGLSIGEWLMLPSGWLGLKSYNILYLLLRRTGSDAYEFIVVNRGGEGEVYHPRWQTAEKILTCPVLKFERVSRERLLDKTFWLLLLSLWMRQNDPQNQSEFIRAEVFYDVLLPWLVEKDPREDDLTRYTTEMMMMASNSGETNTSNSHNNSSSSALVASAAQSSSTAATVFNPFIEAHGCTSPCSSSSAIKSAVTSFCFLLEQMGITSRQDMKRIKYVLKYEFFLRAAEDLSRYAKRFITPSVSSSPSPPAAAPSYSPQQTELLTRDEEKALSASLASMKKAGVKDSATSLLLKDILAEGMKNGIIFKNEKNTLLQPTHYENKMVLVYVGAVEAQGGKGVSTLLADATTALLGNARASAPPVELLFLSCDKNPEQYDEHAGMFSFTRASFPCVDLIKSLDITSVPSLLVFGADGQLVHRDGVKCLRSDPEALKFPGGIWAGALPLSATDVRMLNVGASQLSHHTKKRVDNASITDEEAQHVVELIHAVQEVVQQLPADNVHEIAKENSAIAVCASAVVSGDAVTVSATLDKTLHTPILEKDASYDNTTLLPIVSTAAYYGKPYKSSVPTLEDICNFKPATSYSDLLILLTNSRKVVETLWARSSHSGTASRVAVQMHIIEFITWLFSTMIPVPIIDPAEERVVPLHEAAITSRFYIQDVLQNTESVDMQIELMSIIHYLTISFANAWQAVETPTRAYDSERCLVAMTMLIVFDCIARHQNGSAKGQMMAFLLCGDGGYFPSTSLGKQAVAFKKVSGNLELTRPALLPIRSAVLRYIQHQQDTLRHELFDLRMPDKLEVRKGSATITFLRTFLDNAGFALDQSGSMLSKNASEMEKIMEWLCSTRSPLAKQHEEFIYYRNMVLLAKFLGTMEMRDAQLLNRRKELDSWASWRLSFEEDKPGRQMSASWRTRPAPPKWECAMVRGRDMDIADIIVKGFGDREVMFGDGQVLQSPIDVSRLLEVEHPSEDDVLHAKTLPTFGGTMSPEESEVLLSCLTTPYVRIPLILDFFASQDRNTYLFVGEAQRALRAVLFEPSVYVAPERLHNIDPREVPMRLNAQQRAAVELANLRGDLSKRNYEDCLGTTYGLLLEEITHAPSSVLQPLLRILESITELGPSSVYSSNASYVLYVVGLISDVLSYCRFVLSNQLSAYESLIHDYHHALTSYLSSHVNPLLSEWLHESEVNMDTPTQCVLHAYKAMVDRSLWKGTETSATANVAATAAAQNNPRRREESEGFLVRMLQSSAFVRARHGFGMGMQRTQLAAQEGDSMLSPEEKLLRFLQAQGLDTSKVTKEMLEQGRQLMMSGGRRRAVFVQIRSRFYNDTVRVPNIIRTDATSTTESKLLKLPPADVPENILFHYLLEDHLTITHFLDGQTPQSRGIIFDRVVQSVLRDHSGEGDRDGANHSRTSRSSSMCRSSLVSARASHVNLDEAAAGTVEEWTVAAPGVYRGSASSGLLFHAQTCELFWRNDELKPVPDSMSHFTDFENILGKEILQCGLVSRHENRHWVHIVGTPYDVVEWSEPLDLNNQGVHHPIVVLGDLPAEPVRSAVFEGITYDRAVDITDEDPWAVKEERWAVDMLKEVLRAAFPGGMKFHPLAAALPDDEDEDNEEAPRVKEPAQQEVTEMRFITNDSPQYENEDNRSTWKEFVAYKYPQPMFHVFNLVPHARKLFRSLVFSTNQRYCLHSLALLSNARTRETLKLSAFQAGELKRRVQNESTLEIHRYNQAIHGREVYVPARLLQGLIPSALLESFFLWQGEDNILRGYPLSDESESAAVLTEAETKKKKQQADAMDHWFNYSIEVYFSGEGAGGCVVVRRDDKSYVSVMDPEGSPPAASPTGQKSTLSPPPDRVTNLLYRPTSTSALEEEAHANEDDLHVLQDPEASLSGSDEEEAHNIRFALQESSVSLVHSALRHLPRGVCEDVLRRVGGDIVAAVQWATDSENSGELNAMVNRRNCPGASSMRAASHGAASPVKRLTIRPQDFVLVNLLRCKALGSLLEMLTSLEDASHMMVWGKKRDASSSSNADNEEEVAVDADGNEFIVSFIELPRLRAKFYTQTDGSSSRRLRFFLSDQPGWRIAEPDDFSEDRWKSLRHLGDPFQQCLVLCNSTHEVAFMVPNHDFAPMQISGDPFNALLLFDRSSYTWRESVPSPYYLYVVHPSNGFILPPTLSSSLYYAVMQCATQHYSGALRTLESCYTDTPFSPEEAYMFALFERTIGDAYPDAHAVRLKLAHAIQYSTNEYQWPLAVELTGYLMTKRHISADCRLKESEVIDLLKRCQKAVPLVRSQLELFAGLIKAQRMHQESRDHRADVKIKTPALVRCGFPWERMLLYPWEKISPQKLKRVTYTAMPPDQLVDEKLVEFLFKDELLLDEESGANSKRGFYFLYSLTRGTLKTVLNGQSVSASLFQLLSRWFHLRHARWGREAEGVGETEMAPSWCGTVLQLMHMFPTAEWPSALTPPSVYQMSAGVNLTSNAAMQSWDNDSDDEDNPRRSSAIVDHFNQIHRVARDLFTISSVTETHRNNRVTSQLATPESRPVVVRMFHHIQGRVLPQDTAMKSITFSDTDLGAKYFNSSESRRRTLEALCYEPLSELGLTGKCIQEIRPANGNEEADGVEAPLPFNIRTHPLARAPLAQNMLDRLEEDSARFEEQQRSMIRYNFTCLDRDVIHTVLTSTDYGGVSAAMTSAEQALQTCSSQLFALARKDSETVAALSTSILSLANGVSKDGAHGKSSNALRDHQLRLLNKERVPVGLDWLCGALLSSDFEKDLSLVNPFHGSVSQVRAELALLMMLSNRGFFAEQSALAVQNILLFLEFLSLIRGLSTRSDECVLKKRQRVAELVQLFSLEIQPDDLQKLEAALADSTQPIAIPAGVASMLSGRLQQLLSTALDLITSKRFYAHTTSSSDSSAASLTVELDPRFLLFEFMFNILLRARQVEMVNWFVSNIEEGQSRVQQMIMGQGKTTVVGPLLALILADGKQLITQVMPTALLEQTRGILRRCFSVVLIKHIYTLQFDRSFDDAMESGGVEIIYQKLKSAEEDRSVVIAAPECIKSLFLKSIEQMHMIESISTESLNRETSVDERDASHATTLRAKTIDRSHMADAIVPILQIWKRGVLIMDEVDVLLHPLRSELNFPIGLKHPIDMSGPRWLLPIHLLDAIFYHQAGRACEDAQKLLKLGVSSFANEGDDLPTPMKKSVDARRSEALRNVRMAIAQGFASRALQREPHLVLLDTAYYETVLLPALIPWLQLWLHEQILDRMEAEEKLSFSMKDFNEFQKHTKPFFLSAVKDADDAAKESSAYLNHHLPAFSVKLLNLAHDWLFRLLPHVLSKIDRVSFGVLQPGDLALTADADKVPYSRKMMAVPFVAKDVPSRSSEFAHPDVVIGLTILAYRYEGLRVKDVKELITQLKQDFSRQPGPKEHRPAAKLYRRWLQLSTEDRERHSSAAADSTRRAGQHSHNQQQHGFERAGVPLSQLQVSDKAQLQSLHQILHRVPEVIHYYLCSCIFPRTMNFQSLKISACGHELGSSMLFTKRIGFSGTPSNLLPLDLGECYYEPGSDGRVLSVLTNPSVAQAEVLPDSWTPLKVLDRIAAAQPPYAALIDAGALITNMDNEDVARYLLARLPIALFDGVVFLDNRDRQMILQRDNGLIVPIGQCGVPLSRRFTFFDQVHTTGTDVKQSSTAVAVITLGKDLVFRDYAQGAYRMRGIGKGQRLSLYLIPEVVSRINEVLGAFKTGQMLLDVPAWLLLNSMKVEGLQFFKMSLQELANVWRKKAITNLITDAAYANANMDLFTGYLRCRRFHQDRPHSTKEQKNLPPVWLLKNSIEDFREVIEYPVNSRIEAPRPFLAHLEDVIAAHPVSLIEGDDESHNLINQLLDRMRNAIRSSREAHEKAEGEEQGARTAANRHEHAHQTMDLNAEIVHEQEAEEEQEQEAEQEEQRISAFSRDDEYQIPWSVATLRSCGADPSDTVRPTHGSCFYQLNSFQIRPSQPSLHVCPTFLLSDNYFRVEWHGVGERRLKNAFLFVEWVPVEALPSGASTPGTPHDRSGDIFTGLVTLAEAESLRWLMHHSQYTKSCVSMGLRFVSTGRYMEVTDLLTTMMPPARLKAFRHLQRQRLPSKTDENTSNSNSSGTISSLYDFSLDRAALLYRFFNNDMFFSAAQLEVLEAVLTNMVPDDRLQFFVECLRVRRRHRNHWEDAPIASLFVSASDRLHLKQMAAVKRIQSAFLELNEILLKTVQPRCSSATRREAEAIERQLDVFTSSVTAASSATMSAHSGDSPLLSAGHIALCLVDTFPKVFKAYSMFDVEQAILFAVTKKAASSSSSPAPSPGPDKSDTSATGVPLQTFYEVFPMLDMGHIHTQIQALQNESEKAKSSASMSRLNKEAEPWSCEACTYVNEAHVTSCGMCMSAKPRGANDVVDDITTAADKGREGEDEEEDQGDSPWQCPACTFINDTRTQTVCSVCLGPNPKPLVSSTGAAVGQADILGWECPEGYWMCSVEHGGCSKFNPNAVFYCQVCEKARPNLASVRF